MNTIGGKIKAARKSCGMTQEQLAKRLHTTSAAISRYESGDRRPNLLVLEAIARETGVYVNDLVEPGFWEEVPRYEALASFANNHNRELALSMFSELNEDGQQRAIEYLEMLVASEKYKRLEK